jgi:hypothetical protein
LDASLQKSELIIKGSATEVIDDYFDSDKKVFEVSPKKRPEVIGIKGFSMNQND